MILSHRRNRKTTQAATSPKESAKDRPEDPQRLINSKRLLIYQYDPAQRYDPESSPENLNNAGFLSVPPGPSVPPVDEAIQPETHYVVSETLYDLPVTGFGELHWRSFIEVESLRHLIGWIVSVFRSREDLVLKNLALRQQLLVSHAKRPRRRLSARQQLFFVMLRKL